MLDFLYVGLGGFFGCCLRFLFNKIIPSFHFPYPTLVSNIIAGFIVGVYIGLEKEFSFTNPRLRLFLTTGMMGGLSTFSTFSLETVSMFGEGKYLHGLLNILLNLSLSLAGVMLGLLLAKGIFRGFLK